MLMVPAGVVDQERMIELNKTFQLINSTSILTIGKNRGTKSKKDWYFQQPNYEKWLVSKANIAKTNENFNHHLQSDIILLGEATCVEIDR